MKNFTIRISQRDAAKLGLFVCATCGLPENNHFDFGADRKRPCAHDPRCKDFTPKLRFGQLIKSRG